MKVLNVVAVVSAREGGGNAERTVQLSRALAENDTACTVLTLDIGDPLAQIRRLAGVRLVVVPCANRRFQIPGSCWKIVRDLVREVDVIHLMGHWSLLGVIVQTLAIRAGVPYVICPGGALSLFGRSRLIKRLFNLFFARRLVSRASGFIAVTRSELPDFLTYGVSRTRVVVIPNGVVETDFELFDIDNAQQLEPVFSGEIVLFMGRLNRIKGPDLLLEAFGRVAIQFPTVRLVYAGPDEGMQILLERRSLALGIRDRVNFLGFISGARKAAIYRAACLLVVPSRREAMSIVALEGGIFGKPVLMTDQCGLDDLAEIDPRLIVPASIDGLTAGLRLALESPQRLTDWGVKWRSVVRKRFLWPEVAKQFKDLLDEVSTQKKT